MIWPELDSKIKTSPAFNRINLIIIIFTYDPIINNSSYIVISKTVGVNSNLIFLIFSVP